MTDSSNIPAAFSSPKYSSIMPPAQIAASGFMTFFPVYFGAEPPIGSNIEMPSGFMLPPAAIPMPPWIIAPRSVIMSPNILSVTITSNHSGFFIIHMHVAST